MKKILSRKTKDKLLEEIAEKLKECDISEIENLLDYLTEKEIKDCIDYGACESFIPCIKSKFNARRIREEQLAKNSNSKENPYPSTDVE